MMKRLMLLSAVALGFSLAASEAWAGTLYADVQKPHEWVDAGDSVSGTFNIKNPGSDCILVVCDKGGFDPGKETVTHAVVIFALYGYGELEYEVSLGSDGLQVLSDPPDFQKFGFAVEIDFLNDDSLENLNDNGRLRWVVKNTGEDIVYDSQHFCDLDGFKLKAAVLLAKAENPIPEPSGAMLFAVGLGVAGTATKRRRLG